MAGASAEGGNPLEEFTDDVHDGGGVVPGEIDDQFFGLGDADHPEDAGGLKLGITDDAIYENYHPEDGERIIGEMAELDDVAHGGGGDDEAPGGVVREHKLYAHHGHGAVEQRAYVTCATSAGPIKMMFHRSWSPNGYDRATSLFERGYYDHSHFFRVVPHFLVQFGISYTGDAELRHFANKSIQDDPKRKDVLPFREGMLSFAGSGPNSRTSQLFIAYDKAGGLGNSPWETPFGEVVEGIENVRNLYSGYGDMPPWGNGPEQGPIRTMGSSYIEDNFPLLDKFESCSVERLESPAVGRGAGKSHVTAKDPAAVSPGSAKDATDNRNALRGSDANEGVTKKLLSGRKGSNDSVKNKPSLLESKTTVAISILVFLMIFFQILNRRKISRRAEKNV